MNNNEYSMTGEVEKMYCSIDCETTGLNHRVHEIMQICILPLDQNFVPIKGKEFYFQIKPEHPETADPKALEVNKLDVTKGLSKQKARHLFYQWLRDLHKFMSFEKIVPVGQNYQFDLEFIIDWLGFDDYYDNFNRSYRDTKISAGFLQDTIMPNMETGLHWLCDHFNIENSDHHDAYNDTLVTALVYEHQVNLIKNIEMRDYALN